MQKLLTPLWPAPALEVLEPVSFLTVPGTTADSDDVHARFRKKFRREQGKKLLFCISAHGRYRFELNGRFFGLGPVRGSDFRIFYDTYDLTEALDPGENEITVQEMAEWMGTITYEVYTAISARVERRYMFNGNQLYNFVFSNFGLMGNATLL